MKEPAARQVSEERFPIRSRFHLTASGVLLRFFRVVIVSRRDGE
jgi:hypothetical protein